jgi:serine/threonine protein kinase
MLEKKNAVQLARELHDDAAMKHLAARELPLSGASSTFAAGRPVLRSALDPLLAPGDVVSDRYVVDALIGAGNLGAVYRAHHLQLGFNVALEVLQPRLAQNGFVWRRFASEARALAALHNQHVVRVHDWGKLASGARYLVRDLLIGASLDQVLDRDGLLPAARAVEYVSQVCSALGAAHAAGIVHRAVRTENVFVAQYRAAEPLIKLLNFSTALFLADRSSRGCGSAETFVGGFGGWRRGNEPVGAARGALALAGRLGVRHLSPEQLRSPNGVDPRSDIWAVGLLLFELLAGRSLFAGLSSEQTVSAISTGSLPPRDGYAVPAELDALIGRCLEPDPARRPQSADEVIRELVPFSTRPTHVPFALTQPVRPRSNSPASTRGPVSTRGMPRAAERRWSRSSARASV